MKKTRCALCYAVLAVCFALLLAVSVGTGSAALSPHEILRILLLREGAGTAAYNVLLAFAWAHWAWIKIATSVSVTVFSLSMLVIPVVVAQLSGSVALHGVDRLAVDAAPVERPDLEQAFADWLERSDGCETTIDGIAVRPLVLVAAEGGGIRAATWTVATLAEFAADGRCAADSVFLSSGVSGGSR